MTVLLCFIFFVSGSAALIFEFLWFRQAGLVFGNSVWAASIVLASFMGGLALGNALAAVRGYKIKRPILVFALLQLTIAISGFALVFFFPKLTSVFALVFRSFQGEPLIINFIRTVSAVALMLIPSTAMGLTLPMLVKALQKRMNNFGRALGLLYGWNTLGAVLGVLVGELYFVKWFGLIGTGLVAAGLNIFAALAALWISKKTEAAKKSSTVTAKQVAPVKISFIGYRLLAVAFLSGFLFLALEVVWFRFLSLFFNSHTAHFAVMLAVVLCGISVGGLFISLWCRFRPDAHRLLMPTLLLNGMLVGILYNNITWFMPMFSGIWGKNEVLSILIIALYLIFPISLGSGMIFTIIGRGLYAEFRGTTRATGLLTFVNTIGAACGALTGGGILIPLIGIEKTFFLFSLAYGMLALFALNLKKGNRKCKERKLIYVMAFGFVLVLATFPFGLMNDYLLVKQLSPYKFSALNQGEQRIALKEGMNETNQYLRKDFLGQPLYYRLVTNNHSMSATFPNSRRYMKMFTYLPVAIHPHPKNALLICYGCGMTAKALTDTKTIERITIVDISKDVIEMSSVVFPDRKDNPVYDPRVTVQIEDGRFFLLTTDQMFDVITAEPPPLGHSGVVNLYTQEYFQLIYDRLAEGGIVTYWLPVDQVNVSEAKSILKGFCNVFENCSLWTGTDYNWMMVGIKKPGPPVSESEFLRQWRDPVVGPEIRALGFESAESFGAFFIADGQRLRNWIADTPPLVDNFPLRLFHWSLGERWEQREFLSFKDFLLTRENFAQSQEISKIWPKGLREKALNHFANINATYTPPSNAQDFIYKLHNFINNPSPTKQNIIFLLESDHDMQAILVQKLRQLHKSPLEMVEAYDYLLHAVMTRQVGYQDLYDLLEMYRNIGVWAICQGDYLLAARCYGLLDISETQEPFEQFIFLRMYLLYRGKEKNQAYEVMKDYLSLLPGRVKKKDQIRKYWDWLRITLD